MLRNMTMLFEKYKAQVHLGLISVWDTSNVLVLTGKPGSPLSPGNPGKPGVPGIPVFPRVPIGPGCPSFPASP